MKSIVSQKKVTDRELTWIDTLLKNQELAWNIKSAETTTIVAAYTGA